MVSFRSQLFNNNPKGYPRTKGTGYGSAQKARQTIRLLKKKPLAYKKQVATTMFYRATFHKYQTKGMRNAKKIFSKYLKTLKKKKI